MFTVYVRSANNTYRQFHYIQFDLAWEVFSRVQAAEDFDCVDIIDGLTGVLIATADREKISIYDITVFEND